MNRLKEMLVGTALGDAALRLRDRMDLLKAAASSAESVGTVANDQLAIHLATRLCEPGKVFADVGSHIGSVVAAVQRANPGVVVVAVEAIPEKAERLRKKFPGVSVHGCAVGDHEGTVRFYIDLERSGYSSLEQRKGRQPDHVKEILVPMHTLDTILSECDVDMMKLDIEGAELSALKGCPGLLRRCRPVIMFESAPFEDDRGRAEKIAIHELLGGAGYLVLVPNRVAHDGPDLDVGGFVESHAYPRRTTNFFAIPRERRLEIRNKARALLRVPG